MLDNGAQGMRRSPAQTWHTALQPLAFLYDRITCFSGLRNDIVPLRCMIGWCMDHQPASDLANCYVDAANGAHTEHYCVVVVTAWLITTLSFHAHARLMQAQCLCLGRADSVQEPALLGRHSAAPWHTWLLNTWLLAAVKW